MDLICGVGQQPSKKPWTWGGPPGFPGHDSHCPNASSTAGPDPFTLSDIYCIISNCYNTATFTTDTITGSGICGSQCCIGTDGGNSFGDDRECFQLKEDFRVCGDIGASAENTIYFVIFNCINISDTTNGICGDKCCKGGQGGLPSRACSNDSGVFGDLCGTKATGRMGGRGGNCEFYIFNCYSIGNKDRNLCGNECGVGGTGGAVTIAQNYKWE